MNILFKAHRSKQRCKSLGTMINNTVQKLTLQNKTYKKQYSAILLDFENFKKRCLVEKERQLKSANKEIVKHLLIVLDDLENASMSISNKSSNFLPCSQKIFKNIQDGLALIIRNFLGILRRYEVYPINALGTKFNHLKHEAIRDTCLQTLENDLIVEEYQKGYTLNNNLLRASKVMVNLK